MNTDVAAIIPVYNRVALLGQTLDSIVNQTLPPKEVIVVDDGSREDVEGYIAAYGRPEVRCIRTPNRGVNAARNTGAAAATSRWLAFCDSDDLWLPRKLERQMAVLRLAPDCEYCIVDFQFFNEKGLMERTKFSHAPADYWDPPRRDFGEAGFVLDRNMFLEFLRFQPAVTATVLMSKEQFGRVGGWNEETSSNMAQDFEFHLICASHPPIAIVPEVLVHYRRHSLNWSADELRQDFEGVELLEYMITKYPLARQHEAAFREGIMTRTIGCADRAFYDERYDFFQQMMRRIPWSRRPVSLSARYLLTLLTGPLFPFIHKEVRRLKGTTPVVEQYSAT